MGHSNTIIDLEQLKLPYKASFFLSMLSKVEVGSILLKLPDGQSISYTGNRPGPNADLWIKDLDVVSRLINSSDIGLAESYRDDLIESSDLTELVLWACLNQQFLEKAFQGTFWGMIFYRLRHLLRFNSKKGSKKNIEAHYDLGNSFYKLWLDPSMSYSSALFKEKTDDLKTAQLNKYKRILDGLNLKAGEHILEIGCGWGALALMAAKEYKAKVTCLTLSNEQFAYVQNLVKKEGLEKQIDVKICDYRDEVGVFDHIVSIEMIEAVGELYWDTYFQTLKNRVKSGGKIHIQSITIVDELFESYRGGTDFIQQYIFPGGMMLTPNNIKSKAHSNDLNVLDYFEFGLDYAETLKRWKLAFNHHLEEVRAQGFDEKFIKIWNFYYAYCEAGFLSQRINVAQVLMTKP